ncbi:MAG TPA: sigma-70 family RNA polymerase sigma factor [Gemmatimonadales bacterium]|nr:sigma-70 family RNA polymerase sigma factor [Gemmatimonadales bacterium]
MRTSRTRPRRAPSTKASLVEVISRSLDDASNGRREYERALARDPRARALLLSLRKVRGRLSAFGALPTRSPRRLPDSLWARLSEPRPRRVKADVSGRLSPQFAADFQLAQEAARGDREAWETILRKFGPSLSSLIAQYGLAHEQDDILQDIFLLLWRRIDSFRGDSALKTWILRVAINYLNNYRRRVDAKRRREVATDTLGPSDGQFDVPGAEDLSPEHQLERKTLRETLQAALDRLSPSRKIAVLLRDLQELSYEEIAAILGIPAGTVKSRVARARMDLAALLTSPE